MKNFWPLPRRYYYAAVAALLGVVVGLGGPGNVEALLSPIKTTQGRMTTEMTGRQVCVEYTIVRNRAASHVYQSWTAQWVDKNEVRHRYPIDLRWLNPAHNIPVGSKVHVKRCGLLPDDVPDGVTPIIYGYYMYEVWHGLWNVPWHICKEH